MKDRDKRDAGMGFWRRPSTMAEVMELLHPLLRRWFAGKFRELTEPQALAIPLIHRRRNALISSPTGSGKTLTAFLSIINELYLLQEKGELEDRIYCVYVSPLKALANDIERNLEEPLREINELAASMGIAGPKIRVGVRSGDTTAYERQKMARLPPHLFITTPESLSIVLSSPRFREKFAHVSYVIVDEIHEVCSSKRGVLLSLTLERLQSHVSREFTRIGLSATQAPIKEIARFLVGYDDRGRLRSVAIAVASAQKGLDLGILCPVDDISALPYETANSRMYDRLQELISQHRTTLIFTNTRAGTETLVHRLKERGVESIAAHHGSLSKVTRLEVEESLRSGKLKCVVCSTSLELGIDIGHIDLVCQIGSPKSVAKAIQRIGRAGHGVYETPKGRLLVFDNDDLVECAVLVRMAYEGKIDRISIQRNCQDVLAQVLVGMSLERRWGAEEAFGLVRRSFCYRDLPEDVFYTVLSYLAGRHSLEGEAYAKIAYRDDDRSFGIKKGSRLIFFLNGGTIPEESAYKVFSDRGVPLGSLSEKFVEKLRSGDIFLLGGKTYEFENSRGMKVFVKDARGRRPTVPSWSGEMLPRTYDLSAEIGKFRTAVAKRMASEQPERTMEWLMNEYHCDKGSARSILSYFGEQLAIMPKPPGDRRLVIEAYRDGRGNFNLIFHYCFGRRTNDALSRAYAYAISKEHGVNVSVSLSDDDFMLTLPREIPLKGIHRLVTPANLEKYLRAGIKGTELFKQRFRHCAMRSFMILRNYKGREIPVSRQLYHASRILELLDDDSFPVVAETNNEILQDAMDLEAAVGVAAAIKSGSENVLYHGPSDVPSPFAHGIVLMGISDIVLMEDRSALLREMHRKVLGRAFADTSPSRPLFSAEDLRAYFGGKQIRADDRADILYILRRVGPLDLLVQKGANVFDRSNVDFDSTRHMAAELMKEGAAVSVWRGGTIWIAAEELPDYFAVFSDKRKPGKAEQALLELLAKGSKPGKDKATAAMLRKLEMSYHIHRGPDSPEGEPTYKVRDVQKIPAADVRRAIMRMAARTLEFSGPLMAPELGAELGVDEPRLADALSALEDDGTVSQGMFSPESTSAQFMLTRDRMRLGARKSGARTFDEAQVTQYIIRKQFFGFVSIENYFSRLFEAGMAYDFFNRLPTFDMEKWWELRKNGTVLHGRFSHGRVGYVLAADAPLYVSAYRLEPLAPLDQDVLEFLRSQPGATLSEVVEALSGSRLSRDELKESLDKLDRNLYLIRGFFEKREWSSRNRYFPFEVKPEPEGAMERLLVRNLKAHGPLHIGGVRSATGFDYDRVVDRLQDMEEKGTVVRIVSVGTSPLDLYMLPEDLPGLEAEKHGGSVADRMRILSLYDPYVRRIWAEVANHYGEGWFFPVVKNGALVGMVEKWQMSGCVDVRELVLEDMALLPELLDELDRVMGYYRSMGTDILRVRQVTGKPAAELDKAVLDVFLSKGYRAVQGYLLKGDFVPDVFPKQNALAYMLYKQHIHPSNKFRHTVEAAGAGGVRSDFEAGLRVNLFTSTWRLVRAGVLVSGLGIPEHLSHSVPHDILLYKRAKDRPLDDEMREVLQAMPPYSPITRGELVQRVRLPKEVFAGALKRLYTGLFVIRDSKNKYVLTRDLDIPVALARKKVLRRIVENFGLVTAEALSSYVKHEFKMAEIRDLLKEWELEGWLVKGYLVEGSDALFWIVKSDLGKVAGLDFKGRIVLSPTDALTQYLSQEIRDRFGIGSCFVVIEGTEMTGAFKATLRGGTLSVSQVVGPTTADALKDFSRRWGLKVEYSDSEAPPPTDEWEIITWYEKQHGGKPGEDED